MSTSGAILPCRVEGIKTLFYYRSEDDPMMRDVLSGNVDRRKRLEFIAPLDPFLWDKSLIAALSINPNCYEFNIRSYIIIPNRFFIC